MTTQKVVCTECGFRQVVGPADEKTAAKYVLEHGEDTGHILRLESMSEDGTKEEA